MDWKADPLTTLASQMEEVRKDIGKLERTVECLPDALGDIRRLKEDFAELERTQDLFVRKSDIIPMKRVVYGAVYAILVFVLGYVLNHTFSPPTNPAPALNPPPIAAPVPHVP